MADENKPAFYPRVGRNIAKNFRSAQPPAFIEDPRAMELPQFGDVDLSVPSRENLEMARRMAERDAQLKRQQQADRSPLEKLAGGVQAGRFLGSALTQAVNSLPTRIAKGDKAAEQFMQERIYKPEQPLAYEYAGDIGDFLERLETQYKLPPILPEAVALQYLTGPATSQAMRTAGKGAQALEQRMAPAVTQALDRGGLQRNLLLGLGQGTQANVINPTTRIPAPQAEALRLAQQRAALPVDQFGLGLPKDNTPEQRANAMDFDRDTYHGSLRDIKKLDPRVGSTESHAGRGVYSTDLPEDASLNYASIYGPDVSGRVSRGMEERDKDFRKIHGRMRDQELTPRQQEIILQNTVGADNLGVVYPLKVRADKPIHLDEPETNPVRIGPFQHYDDAADAYLDTPHTEKFNEALDEFRGLGGEANPIYELVQDYGDVSIPARDVFNVVKKTGNESGLYDPDTGDIVSGGVAAGDFVKHFGIDEIRHTPQFRNRELNIGTEHTISLDPDNVRSRFAAFDPWRRSAAIAAAMGVAAPDLLAEEKKLEKKKADGGKVSISNNPDTMMLEVNNQKMKNGVPAYSGAGLIKGGLKAAKPPKIDVPIRFPVSRGPSVPEIRAMAERMAPQVMGEFVRAAPTPSKPNPSESVVGKSRKQFEREKTLPIEYENIKEPVTPEEFDYAKKKGALLIGAQGDVTPGNRMLISIDNQPLSAPVHMQAGPEWELYNPSAWAATDQMAKTYMKRAKKAAEEYEADPYLHYHKMTPDANWYAMHHFNSVLGHLRPEELKLRDPKLYQQMIEEIRTKDVGFGKHPEFEGFDDPLNLQIHAQMDPNFRRHIGAIFGGPKFTTRYGLNSGQDVLAATSLPELRDLEAGASGYAVVPLDVNAPLRNFEADSQTYDTGFPKAGASGRSKYPSPYQLIYRDTLNWMKDVPSDKKSSEFGRMNMIVPKQQIDNELIEAIGEYQRRMKELTGKKKGGAVKKAEGGYLKKPAAYINGDEFVNAAKKHGIKDSINNLNKIVDLVNKGLSVDDAARQVADTGMHKAAGGAISGDDLILEERPL